VTPPPPENAPPAQPEPAQPLAPSSPAEPLAPLPATEPASQAGASTTAPVPVETVAPPPAPVAPSPPAPLAPSAPAPVAPKVRAQSTEVLPSAEEQNPSARQLYIRLGAGFGFPFGPDVADKYEDRGRDALHFSGYSFAMDMMAGAAVLPGLVVGGGAASDTVAGGTVRNGNQDQRHLEHSLYYAVIGGFADFYTAPPAGLHVQALIGLARLSPSSDLGHNTALGFGTVLGVGYDLPVGRRWNLGGLARLAFSPLGMQRVAGQQPSPTFYEPSLLWTATFRPER
jgi:hypothetical protein